jgi:hypothetical protein
VNDTGYADLPPEIVPRIEATYPKSKADRGVWNHYGILILLGISVVYRFLFGGGD